jgi:hypothetical protein
MTMFVLPLQRDYFQSESHSCSIWKPIWIMTLQMAASTSSVISAMTFSYLPMPLLSFSAAPSRRRV